MLLPARIQNKIAPEPNTGCWLWTAAGLPRGYGVVRWDGRQQYAHRVVYEIIKGQIVEGFQLDHLCRMPCCVNPEHLEPVTCKENNYRGIGSQFVNVMHCKHGHEFTPDNIYWGVTASGKNKRNCRACALEHSRKTYARAKGELGG